MAGSQGGQVIFEGSLFELKSADTLTAEAFRKRVVINQKPLPWQEGFEIRDAHCHMKTS